MIEAKKNGLFDDAEKSYKEAYSQLTDDEKESYTVGKLNFEYATILILRDHEISKATELLRRSILIFDKYSLVDDVAHTKQVLAQTKAHNNDFYEAEILVKESLEYNLAKKSDYNSLGYTQISYAAVMRDKGDYISAKIHLKEALVCATRLAHSSEQADQNNSEKLLAWYHHLSAEVAERLGNPHEAKIHGQNALKYFQTHKEGIIELQLLFILVKSEFAIGCNNMPTLLLYLNKLKYLSLEMKVYRLAAESIFFHYEVGKSKELYSEAVGMLIDNYEIIEKSDYKEHMARYYLELASHCLEISGQNDLATDYAEQLITYSQKHNLTLFSIKAYILMGRIKKSQENKVESIRYFDLSLNDLKIELGCAQSDSLKTDILDSIARVYWNKGQLRMALKTFEENAQIQNKLPIKHEYYSTLFRIGDLNMLLNDMDEALKNWQLVAHNIDDSIYCQFGILAKIRIAKMWIKVKEYSLAKPFIDEAKYYDNKYKFGYDYIIRTLLTEVVCKTKIFDGPIHDFSYVISKLYSGDVRSMYTIDYWYEKYRFDILGNFYKRQGLTAIFFEYSSGKFKQHQQYFSWLFDYFLQTPPTIEQTSNIVTFKYPFEAVEEDDKILQWEKFNENLQTTEFIDDKIMKESEKVTSYEYRPRYSILKKLNYGEEEYWCKGNCKNISNIALDFFTEKSVGDILKGKHFILDSFAGEEDVYNEILLCWQMGFLPVYGDYKKLNNLTIVSKIEMDFPVYFKSKKIKNSFVSMLNIEHAKVKSTLNELSKEINNGFLIRNRKIKLTICFVELDQLIKKVVHPVIIM